jgi:hypothetical protein
VARRQQAQAASDDNFILGKSNNAGATTYLEPSVSTSLTTLLWVTNSSTFGGTGVTACAGDSGTALLGSANGIGTGLVAGSDAGIGVSGSSSSGVDFAASGTGRIWPQCHAQVGPPSSGGPYG